MRTVGIIIARAGSQGLPHKHLRPLLGRPVIAYTFDHARAARRLDAVGVSSDAPEVLDLARREGFTTIDRPAELATADAAVQAVLLHAVGVLDARVAPAQAVVLLYGNCPVRPPGVIDAAIELLERTGADSVRSFAPVGKLHPAWMARLEDDRVVPLQPGSIHRRQDLAPLYHHDGAVVAVTRASLLRQIDHPDDPHAFFGLDRRALRVSAGSTVEIDQELDLYLAEAVLRGRGAARSGDQVRGPTPETGS
jgi:CMP-N,N'-diacetyllegionaminic acid synthase